MSVELSEERQIAREQWREKIKTLFEGATQSLLSNVVEVGSERTDAVAVRTVETHEHHTAA